MAAFSMAMPCVTLGSVVTCRASNTATTARPLAFRAAAPGGSTRALAMSGGRRSTTRKELVVCASQEAAVPKKGAAVPKKSSKEGILAPLVILSKKVLGDKELGKIRGKVIALHGEVIGNFVATADTEFGDYILRALFELADTNKNGTIEEEELATALKVLGFNHLKDNQIKGIFDRADLDSNGELDFEEWKKQVPPTLKTNLKKLAKTNGEELGFLA